jgi:hypothetical protein
VGGEVRGKGPLVFYCLHPFLMDYNQQTHLHKLAPKFLELQLLHVTNKGVSFTQGVTKRCRLSWWPNSALVYEPKCGEGGELGVSANEYNCAHHVTWSPNKLWRSNFIFNLCVYPTTECGFKGTVSRDFRLRVFS